MDRPHLFIQSKSIKRSGGCTTFTTHHPLHVLEGEGFVVAMFPKELLYIAIAAFPVAPGPRLPSTERAPTRTSKL